MSSPTRKLRDALEDLTAGIDEIDAVLFTTFGLSVEFFEDCVLGALALDQFKLSSAQDIFGASEYCDRVNLGVFYDANITDAVDKRVTFDSYPVFPKQGVFHPKLILVSGRSDTDRIVRLLVSSANLSLAGWAKNREVFSTIEIGDAHTASPLLQLLDYLFSTQRRREAELREKYSHVVEHLSKLSDNSSPGPTARLHVTIPERTPSLMQYLAGQNIDELTVFSPYFGSRPFDYLSSACPDGSVTVVAAQDEEGRLPIPATAVTAVNEAESSPIRLARIPKSDDNEYRFDHFKAYSWPGSLLVGSHNATQAALGLPDGTGHRNVEVSVQFTDARAPKTVEFDTPPQGTPEDQLEPPEDLLSQRLPGSIAVTADWKEEHFIVELGEAMPDCSIDLPGIAALPLPGDETFTVPFSDTARVELLEKKWFEVHRRHPKRERIYRGLINEMDWRTYRREAVLDSLTACFDAWVTGTVDDPTGNEDHLVPASERLLADSEQRAKPLKAGPIDDNLFENYFRFFRASQRYRDRLAHTVDNDDATGCARLLVSAPGSLQRVLELVEKQIERDGDEFWSVYRLVLVHELRRLLAWLRGAAHQQGEVMEVIDKLAPRTEALVERFEQHPAWQNIHTDEEIKRAAQFVMQKLGYSHD